LLVVVQFIIVLIDKPPFCVEKSAKIDSFVVDSDEEDESIAPTKISTVATKNDRVSLDADKLQYESSKLSSTWRPVHFQGAWVTTNEFMPMITVGITLPAGTSLSNYANTVTVKVSTCSTQLVVSLKWPAIANDVKLLEQAFLSDKKDNRLNPKDVDKMGTSITYALRDLRKMQNLSKTSGDCTTSTACILLQRPVEQKFKAIPALCSHDGGLMLYVVLKVIAEAESEDENDWFGPIHSAPFKRMDHQVPAGRTSPLKKSRGIQKPKTRTVKGQKNAEAMMKFMDVRAQQLQIEHELGHFK